MTGPCSMNASFYLARCVHREAQFIWQALLQEGERTGGSVFLAQSRHYTSQRN